MPALISERNVNLSAQTKTLQAIFHFFPFNYHKEEHITWKRYQEAMLQILQGAQLGFVEVRSLTVKMNVLSIFTLDPSLLGGSEGMLPRKF